MSKITLLFNDTHREKLSYSIKYKSGYLPASNLFMFAQSIKFYYIFHYIIPLYITY